MRVIARMNVGGPAMQVAGLSKFLPVAEFDQRLVSGNVADDEADFTRLYELDIPITQLGSVGRSFSSLRDSAALLQLVGQIKEFQPDIIHSHTAKAGLLARVASILSGVKSRRVHTFHGHLLTGYFSPVTLAAVVNIERILASKTDLLITVGDRVRDQLLARGIGQLDKYSVIPPGLAELEVVAAPMAKRALGLGADDFVVLYLGRLTKIKRVDRLLASIALATSRVPNLKVLIAGDGELRSELEASTLAQRLPVQFLGWRNDLGVLLGSADCVVLTSDNEGTPVSLIQAAQAGVAVVATDVGSVSEVVEAGGSGILTSDSPREIADAIVNLATDSQFRHRLGARGAALAKDRYSYQRLSDDHARLYREVMESQP
jgi:glycosyltransferase involved in cell wall biosynthesis